MKKKIIIGASVLIVALLAWKIYANKNANQATYQTTIVEKGTLVNSISGTGNVLSANTFTVKTSASGVVTKVYVKDGNVVVKGQKIAKIELDLDGEQQYAQANSNHISTLNQLQSAENSLRSAQATLDNIYDQIKGHDNDETLAMKETRTKAEVTKDNAYNSVTNAKASLVNADYNLRANSPMILAPNSGTVSGLTIAEGLPLSAQTTTTGTRTGQRIASIVKEGSPLVSINLSEIDIPNVKVGQKATITFDSIADKTFSGTVTAIDRTGNTTNNVTTYSTIIKLDTGTPEILANMAVSAQIITNIKTDALLVPSTALNNNSVQVMKNNKPISVAVTVGESNDTQTEILTGLSEGETVVTATTNNSATTTTSSTAASPFSGLNRTGAAGATRNTRTFVGGGF